MRARMVMWPREHGAYSQMALPLVTALVIARAAPPAVFVAVAVVCGFLAHEPLVVLLGGRGPRVRRADGLRAAIWFATTATALVAAGAAAVWVAPVDARWSFLVPLVPAAWVGASLLAKQEKQASAEIAVAPGLGIALVLAMRRSPPPLKTVGWSLASTSAAAALILICVPHLS